MSTYEGIRQAQIAARHYANLLAEKSKKRISKKNSKQDKEYSNLKQPNMTKQHQFC